MKGCSETQWLWGVLGINSADQPVDDITKPTDLQVSMTQGLLKKDAEGCIPCVFGEITSGYRTQILM